MSSHNICLKIKKIKKKIFRNCNRYKIARFDVLQVFTKQRLQKFYKSKSTYFLSIYISKS